MDRFTHRTGCCCCRRHGSGGRFRFGFRFIRHIRGLGRSGSFATTRVVSVAFALSFSRRFCTFTRRTSAHLSLAFAVSFTLSFSRGTVAFAVRVSLSFSRRFRTFARRSSAFAKSLAFTFTLTLANARVHWRVCPDQRKAQEEEGDDRKLHAA